MSIARVIALALALGLAAVLTAQEFDPFDYYDGAFRIDPNRKHSGVLDDTLTDKQPHWIEFSGSGEDLAKDRFMLTESGLSFRPNRDHGTCEAVIDVGLSNGTLEVEINEMARGSAVAWHLRDLGSETAWLIELTHKEDGTYELRIRKKSGRRYSVVPDSTQKINQLALPAKFIAYVSNSKLTGEVAGTKTEHADEPANGVSAGLAVTDETARLINLSLDITLHENWIVDAHDRLRARHALSRLREFATVGLLSGIAEQRHPEIETALEAFSEEDRAARNQAMGADIYERAGILVKLANAHPKLPAAQHEAGVAALIAGDVAAAKVLLTNADKLKASNITSLALAEANRRAGDIEAAENALREADAGLPDALRADYALIDGRLRAERGDIQGAHQVLSKASRDHADHQQLQAFADSAAVLYDPAMLQQSSVPGPLGLTLLTDLSPAQFVPVLNKLKPYIEKFRVWLPELADELDGRIAIFSGPVSYLRAGLLVAGDNLDNVAGMYLSHGIKGGPTVMACRAFGEDELLRTLVHELWHLALASTGAEDAVPRWLNEGMAVFLSAGRVQDGIMRYDTLPSEFEGFLKAPPTAEQGEAAINAVASEFYVPAALRENYASAWAVAMFIATSNNSIPRLRAMLAGDVRALAGVQAGLKMMWPQVSAAVKKFL